MLWNKGKRFGEMYTDGQLDVLGFDPRGVNLSSPSISCFPHDAYRDRWRWLVQSWPEVSGYDTLNRMDAINEATLRACEDKYGDIPRFLTTAFVARDVDAIREALGEDTLTAFMVSYGTGIGQTYAQMFPDRVGNVALDGMEFVRDGWTPWGWSVTSLDNVTDAFEDGLIGECVRAGPKGCALAMDELQSDDVYESAREALSSKVHTLIQSTKQRPISGVSSQGAGIVSYENLVEWLYHLLYQPPNWKSGVQALAELENGNATLVLEEFHKTLWTFDPSKKRSSPQSSELEMMVLCGDSADAEQKSLAWWKDLHVNMTAKSWISGSSRLSATLPCRHFKWQPAEIYRGGFNNTLRNPLLLIGGPYDPATPLRNGRRLAKEMGNNARMLVHHGYGHSSARDLSACSNAVIQAYILNGTVPQTAEVHCHADKKPFDADFLGVP
ncbi:hypothetical protein CI109_101356 [Kwoniella shandongensis]|uniref:Peptidase S33 tripeptidyl aminopeptidase-like C-terminal domain-containing protein n=1 Tax=Kwoniella shandongensis TaxID=1734106 RepID=A0AAJ8LFM5_9TREE